MKRIKEVWTLLLVNANVGQHINYLIIKQCVKKLLQLLIVQIISSIIKKIVHAHKFVEMENYFNFNVMTEILMIVMDAVAVVSCNPTFSALTDLQKLQVSVHMLGE